MIKFFGGYTSGNAMNGVDMIILFQAKKLNKRLKRVGLTVSLRGIKVPFIIIAFNITITKSHTSYLSRADGPGPWRKNLSCGEISKFCTWNMWRKLKFVHMWINFKFLHMTDVEKSEISFILCTIYGILLHFTLFWWKICFFFGDLRWFVAKSILQFTHFFVWRKI